LAAGELVVTGMTLPPEIIVITNGTLLVITIGLALLMARASVRYQRGLGDIDVQRRQTQIIINLLLLLIALGLAAAGFNLLTAV
jgi:hypothetical protein